MIKIDPRHEQFLSHLTKREGRRDYVYLDSLGIPTAGVGHRITDDDGGLEEGDLISEEQINEWLLQDSQSAWLEAVEKAQRLGINEKSPLVEALASVNFQLGNSWEKEHKATWKLMKEGEWEAAALEAADSTWNDQTPVRVEDFQDAIMSHANLPKMQRDNLSPRIREFIDGLAQAGRNVGERNTLASDEPTPQRKPVDLGGEGPLPEGPHATIDASMDFWEQASALGTEIKDTVGDFVTGVGRDVKETLGFAAGGPLDDNIIPDQPPEAVTGSQTPALPQIAPIALEGEEAPSEAAPVTDPTPEYGEPDPEIDPLEQFRPAPEVDPLEQFKPVDPLEQFRPTPPTMNEGDAFTRSALRELSAMTDEEKDDLVGSVARWDTAVGIAQLFGRETDATKKQYIQLGQIMRDDPAQMARYVGNSFLDPIQLFMMAVPIPGTGTLSKAWSASRIAGVGVKAARIAMGGAAGGFLGYVDESQESFIGEGNQTRGENTLMGAAIGSAFAPIGMAANKAIRAATPASLKSSVSAVGSKLNGVLDGYENGLGKKAWSAISRNPVEAGGTLIGATVGSALAEEDDYGLGAGIGALAGAALGKGTKSVRSSLTTLPDALGGVKGDTLNDSIQRLFVDNFKLPEGYVTFRKERAIDSRTSTQAINEVASKLDKALEPDEQAIAYRMLRGELGLTDHQFKNQEKVGNLLMEARDEITAMSQLMVDKGLLSKEMMMENVDNYLRASYTKRTDKESTKEMLRVMRNAKVIGDSLHSRGTHQVVDEAKFKSMQADGLIGSRATDTSWDVTSEGLVNGKKQYSIRRLYTKSEREIMGEIENVSYALVKTANVMSKDVTSFKFFDKIATDKSISSSVPVEGWKYMEPDLIRGAKGGEAITSAAGKGPKTKFGVDKRGNLAGKWVHPEVHADLKRMESLRTIGNTALAKGYMKFNQMWKATKTIYNPAVHSNNMVSNVVMYDIAGGGATHFARGVKSMMKKDELYSRALKHGAFEGGTLENETGELLLKGFRDNNIFSKGMDPANIGDKAKDMSLNILNKAKTLHNKIADVYQAEDSVFRMGLFLSRKAAGDTDEQAASFARRHMIDYEINAPGVQALRQTALPFFSYTYRVAPLLGEAAVTKPWKAAKWLGFLAAVNELGESTAEAEGLDVEGLRRTEGDDNDILSTGISSRIMLPGAGGTMLNVGRFIPGGDIFAQSEGEGLVNFLPASVQPTFGSIGAIIYRAVGKDPFTGGDIKGSKTTPKMTFVKGVIRDFTPNNILFDPFVLLGGESMYEPESRSYISRKIGRAMTEDYQGVEERLTVSQAILSGFGIKLNAFDLAREEELLNTKHKRTMSDIVKDMKAAGEARVREGWSDAEVEEVMEQYMLDMAEASKHYLKRTGEIE